MQRRDMINRPKRKIAFYGRVSTEHEAQLSALQNQMQWYDDILAHHDDWEYVDRYIDEGITGTLARKREHFLDMIADAKKGRFDLIVTREVCRFARNTVDTLEYTRLLKKYGVEVYFVEDNIYTFSSDGELRLTIMAALAQEESRKVSERVLAGQKISRENGVLYGSGNILGYELHRNIDENGKWNPKENTYVINEEQAETVRMIYDMYIDGYSTTRIARELSILKRKGSSGKEIKWSAARVGDILHNKTYAGYIGYNKSETTDYLEHSRKANYDRSTYEYVKADFEAIIPEEKWMLVQSLMEEKSLQIPSVNFGKHKHVGKKKVYDMWSNILKCSCGASFRKNKWRINKKSQETIWGYQCYNQLNNGSYDFRVKNGLSVDGFCAVKMISDWKLDMMAKKIIQELWQDRMDSVKLALKLVQDNYVSDDASSRSSVDKSLIKKKISTLESRSERLLELRLDDMISKDEFTKKKAELEKEMEELKAQLVEDEEPDTVENKVDVLLKAVEKALNEYIDFSKVKIADDIVEKLVKQVTVYENYRFKFLIDFTMTKQENAGASEVFLFRKHIGYEEAYDYRKEYGYYIRKNQWKDLTVEVWTTL